MTLKMIELNPVYESQFGTDSYLVNEFYRPLLGNSLQYDRLAGYLSLQVLADTLKGADTLLESDGDIRLLVGSDKFNSQDIELLSNQNKPLTDTEESYLAIISKLLEEDRLKVKIGVPSHSGSGIFHPKLGIVTDSEDNTVTFEGSVNETIRAWKSNYERFKVHRSWIEGESKYVEKDKADFERLWSGEHPDVDVFTVSEALEEELIDWRTDSDKELEQHIENLQSDTAQSDVFVEGDIVELVENAEDSTGSLHIAEDISPINLWPHQRVVSDTAVSIYPENVVLCDEVGLGKTIEAGITLSRLIFSGDVENALLLVPYGVMRQWQEELWEKFNLYSVRYDRGSGNQKYFFDPLGQRILANGEINDAEWINTPIGSYLSKHSAPNIVLVSWHTARMDRNRQLVLPNDDMFEWDLTIVDEAHSARKDTRLYKLLSDVNQNSDALYSLTATPMQTGVDDLYDVLRLCDLPGGDWEDREKFKEFFNIRQVIQSSLRNNNNNNNKGSEDIYKNIAKRLEIELEDVPKQIGLLCSMLRDFGNKRASTYNNTVQKEINNADLDLQEKKKLEDILQPDDSLFDTNVSRNLNMLSKEALNVIYQVSLSNTPIQSRMFRNTRETLRKSKEIGLIDENIPKRDVDTITVELDDSVRELYNRIDEYIRTVYKKAERLDKKKQLAIGFVMTTYRQRLTSSLHSASQSLQRRRQKLLNDLSTEEEMTDQISMMVNEDGLTADELAVRSTINSDIDGYTPSQKLKQEELEELDNFIQDLQRKSSDPKLQALHKHIRKLEQKARDSVIIFTQYEDTVETIKKSLIPGRTGVGTYTGSGAEQYNTDTNEWENISKEAVKQKFKSKEENMSILICTDSASEGLNLQTCDALINYDLPWNPMRVEQRIGRIDRIGQENEVLKIINFVYEDTVDGDIYERLDDRIGLFENVVGPMRPVLDGIEEQITKASMTDSEKTTSEIIEDVQSEKESAEQTAEKLGILTDSELDTKEEIINDAKLEGWDNMVHPEITSIGSNIREAEPYFSPKLVEYLLAHSEKLEKKGWGFKRLESNAPELDMGSNLYMLRVPQEHQNFIGVAESQDTLQSKYPSKNEVLVTFEPRVINDYPSVRLLLPGDPIYDNMIDILSGNNETSDILTRVKKNGKYIYVSEFGDTELPNGKIIPSEELVTNELDD